jgi:hypothetical protein
MISHYVSLAWLVLTPLESCAKLCAVTCATFGTKPVPLDGRLPVPFQMSDLLAAQSLCTYELRRSIAAPVSDRHLSPEHSNYDSIPFEGRSLVETIAWLPREVWIRRSRDLAKSSGRFVVGKKVHGQDGANM